MRNKEKRIYKNWRFFCERVVSFLKIENGNEPIKWIELAGVLLFLFLRSSFIYSKDIGCGLYRERVMGQEKKIGVENCIRIRNTNTIVVEKNAC